MEQYSLSVLDTYRLKSIGIHEAYENKRITNHTSDEHDYKLKLIKKSKTKIDTITDEEKHYLYGAHKSLINTPEKKSQKEYQALLYNPDINNEKYRVSVFNNAFSYYLLINQSKSANEKGEPFNIDKFVQQMKIYNAKYKANLHLHKPTPGMLMPENDENLRLCSDKFFKRIDRIEKTFVTDTENKIDSLLFYYKRERSFHHDLLNFYYANTKEQLVKVNGQYYHYPVRHHDELLSLFAALPNAFSRNFYVQFLGNINQFEASNALRYLLNITFPIFEHLFAATIYQHFNCSLEKSIESLSSYVKENYDDLTYHFLDLPDALENKNNEEMIVTAEEKRRLAHIIPKIYSKEFLKQTRYWINFEPSSELNEMPYNSETQYLIAQCLPQIMPPSSF